MSTAPRLRHHGAWLAVGWGLVLLVVYLSLTPDPVDAGQVGSVSCGHFLAYFVLMFWFAQLYRSRSALLGLAAAFALLGVTLELAQWMTTYRTFDFADMRDNALGVAVGFALGNTPLGLTLSRLERWAG